VDEVFELVEVLRWAGDVAGVVSPPGGVGEWEGGE